MNIESNIIELIEVTHDVTWLAWGVQYFFLIGLSVGAFLLTLPAFVFRRTQLQRTAQLALVIAITCGIAAPIALVSDLHQPGRFYNFYLHFTPGSWMSWGAFFLPVYVVLLMIYAWLVYRPGLAQQAKLRTGMLATVSQWLAGSGQAAPQAVRGIGLLTLVAALLVVLYTGAEMGVVEARPLWHTPMLSVLYLLTGLSGAAGLGLLLNRFIADGNVTVVRQLNRILFNLLSITLLAIMVWFFTGLATIKSYPSGEALIRLATEYAPIQFTLVWLGLCTLLPWLMTGFMPAKSWWFTAIASFAGAWLFRWSMFIDGQRIPKTGAGFTDYGLPLGHEGLLGMFGTLGLWVLLLLLVTTFLPWQGKTSSPST